jgi:hypothetical protein
MKNHRVIAVVGLAWTIALGAAAAQARAASAGAHEASAVDVIFACDFVHAEGGYTAALVQSSDPALVQGVRPGQRCVDALATLIGRFAALRHAGAEVSLRGPFFGVLGEGDTGGGVSGCDIWDFMGVPVGRSDTAAKDTLVGILTCGPGDEGPVVLGAESNRDTFIRGVEDGTPCAEAVAELSGRFHKLTAQRRTTFAKIRPLADRVLVKRVEADEPPPPTLRYYYVAAFR